MSQPKVFEFAKEIGMSPLALMDKIREWKLPVRSHMAELEPEVLEQIRDRLNGGGGDEAPAKAAPKTAKKKATPKATAAKKATKATSGAVAGGPKKATKKAAPTDDGAATKKAGAVKKAPAKVVIRRKSDEEEQLEAAAAAAAAAAEQEALEAQEAADAAQDEVDETPAETYEVEAAPVTPIAAAKLEVAPPPEDEEMEDEAPEVDETPEPQLATAPAAPIAVEPPSAQASTASATPAASVPSQTQTSLGGPPSLGNPTAPARKREVVMTSSGPISGVRSDAPRRNIVGRMDLSRVQAPPRLGGGGPITSGPGGGGFRPGPAGGGIGGPRPIGAGGPGRPGIGGPRPLRTGFVSSAPVEIEDEATLEARRKFDERKARVKAGTPVAGAPGAKEKEEEVQQFSSTEFRKREMVFQPKKKKGMLSREAKRTQLTTPKASKRVVKVDQSMKLSDLANEMGVKAGQLTKVLVKNGVMATMNTILDFDTIALIAPEFGHEALNVHRTVDQMLESTAFGEMDLESIVRPPVVTIMGHVDHGKTSLLDAIRKANVAGGEAGGITQHIGAYQVQTESGALITFIDTPGHEAFTAMRARGADVTDIVVIVVAADDGVMPQTVEAVSHAKAAGVPIIVAVNKMDKAGANPDRVKQQLTEQQLVPEEWGGDTIYVPVSAQTRAGLPELLEQIYLVAEVAELKANPKRSATGVVIESRMDKGRGPVATLLIQDGTLRLGESVVCGSVAGRVRGLVNDKGERVKEAGPSVPVEILGLSEVPMAGDRFDAVEDDRAAENVAKVRKAQTAALAVKGKISMEDIFSKLKAGDVKELAIVLKTDVAGSIEAIKGMFDKVGTSEVKVKIVHSGVGGINESDVLLAGAAKGIVVGFNVRPDGGAQTSAKRQGVEIKTYTIVYELMDEMKKAMGGLLTPDIVEKQLGRAEARNIFSVPKIGTIAGCFVTEGKITRNAEVRLVRDGKIVYTGKLGSLKRFKDDAKEVASGYECGLSIENFNDVKVGDIIEAFTKESVVRDL